MRAGGSKAKGSAYERQICKALSLWVSSGKAVDIFWRSAMSGGRATVSNRKGVSVRQAGDITAVAPEGHALTDRFYIECKHVQSLDLEAFCLTGKGALAKFWRVACREAQQHRREPIIIARQNRTADLVISRPQAFKKAVVKTPSGMCISVKGNGVSAELRYLEDVLACPLIPHP